MWAGVILLAVGCGSNDSKRTDEGGKEPAVVAERATARPYVVPEAGIRFEPPERWDPARVRMDARSGSEADSIQPGADYCVTFAYRAEQPAHQDEPILQLLVFPKSAWGRLEAAPGAPAGGVIDSAGAWVFVAALPRTNPYRAGLLDADQFEAMSLTFADVRDAFSVEGTGPADPTLRADSKAR